MNSFHMESIWKRMESIWKKYGIHVEKPWNPSTIPWNPSTESMESIPHSMESIPPFHGTHLEFLQSTPHSMDSTWNNPGRVKYCSPMCKAQLNSQLCFLKMWNLLKYHCIFLKMQSSFELPTLFFKNAELMQTLHSLEFKSEYAEFNLKMQCSFAESTGNSYCGFKKSRV